MSDELLVDRAQCGDALATELLIKKYHHLVRIKTKKYFLVGADREDILQEGAIGLYKAILDFRREKLSTFRTFAEICIKRQVIRAIKAAVRQKHVPLNSYISYDTPIPGGDSDQTLLDVISTVQVTDPEELVIKEDVSRAIRGRILKNLSTLEHRVLIAHLEGKSCHETATELHRPVKAVDNALQRVKHKLERRLTVADA